MDLKNIDNQEKLSICRKYYYVGFAVLPFVWFVNSIWFFEEAFKKPIYPEQAKIKFYVTISMIGCTFYFFVFLTWIIIFQTNRVSWGEFGDKMSLVIPKGYL